MSFVFRDGTTDERIFTHVVMHNEYRLPARFTPDDIVLDIGAHIGSFSFAALTRGAGTVYLFEPDRGNCAQIEMNLLPHIAAGRARLQRAAVWRSDRDEITYHGGYSIEPGNLVNSGGMGVIWAREGEGESLPTLPFDSIMDAITENGSRRVRLLKIDCEGSEWPILLTSKRLHLIDEVCGEFHELGGRYHTSEAPFAIDGLRRFTISDLRKRLADCGFSSVFHRGRNFDNTRSHCGLFFASRARVLSLRYLRFLVRLNLMLRARVFARDLVATVAEHRRQSHYRGPFRSWARR